MPYVPTNRTYGDACPISRALDVVGERWALLVVRELLLGPQRFAALRRALPGASSNLLTDRLRELEKHGVVRRQATQGYALTDAGRDLEPVVLALGTWGLRLPRPEPAHLSAVSVLLFLRGSRRAAPAGVYRLELDDRVWTVRTGGGVHVEPGAPDHPDAALRTDPATLNRLLADPSALATAVAAGTAVVDGDRAALRRLLLSR